MRQSSPYEPVFKDELGLQFCYKETHIAKMKHDRVFYVIWLNVFISKETHIAKMKHDRVFYIIWLNVFISKLEFTILQRMHNTTA